MRVFLQNLVAIVGGVDKEQDINTLGNFSPWDIAKWRYDKYAGPRPIDNPLKEIVMLRERVQQDIANESNGRVFVKTHWALGQFFGYRTINPAVTLGAVYTVRNPLDVVISLAEHLNFSIDETITFMCTQNAMANARDTVVDWLGSWSQNVASWTQEPNPAISVVRYEDLLSDPEVWFGVVSRHLLIKPPPALDQIRKAVERSSFDRLKKQEETHGFYMKPNQDKPFFRNGRVGQWKNTLTRQQIDRIVEHHHDQMARFGYMPEK